MDAGYSEFSVLQANGYELNYTVTKQIVSDTLKKLNALSEETCAELNTTAKRRKQTEFDHSIKSKLKQAKDACFAKVKEQTKQQTVAEGKQHSTHSKGRGDMAL